MRYPHGTTPLLYRLTMKSRNPARAAVLRMLAHEPKAIVISHGEWFKTYGIRELQQRVRNPSLFVRASGGRSQDTQRGGLRAKRSNPS